jgi:hypothetical protein
MINMRNHMGDDEDHEFDPDARPDPKPKERNPYDDNAYDPEEEAMKRQAEDHDADEAMENEHEREVVQQKENQMRQTYVNARVLRNDGNTAIVIPEKEPKEEVTFLRDNESLQEFLQMFPLLGIVQLFHPVGPLSPGESKRAEPNLDQREGSLEQRRGSGLDISQRCKN